MATQKPDLSCEALSDGKGLPGPSHVEPAERKTYDAPSEVSSFVGSHRLQARFAIGTEVTTPGQTIIDGRQEIDALFNNSASVPGTN